MSTTLPKFENDDRASLLVDEPTVIASATRAGEEFAALVFELPAAIAYVTPDVDRVSHRGIERRRGPPPRLMLATAGLMRFSVTQLTPEMTPEFEPDPLQLSTRTAYSVTPLCDAVGRCPNSAGDVRAVPVAVVGALPVVDEAGSVTMRAAELCMGAADPVSMM